MYYTGKYLGAKLQARERVYLYDNGDECTGITGGWSISGANIVKEIGCIKFIGGSPYGDRRINTINKIQFNSSDRLYIKLSVNAIGVASTGFNAVRTTQTSSSSYRLKNTKLAVRYPSSEFQPNVIKTIMFYEEFSFNEVISLVNNNQTWKVYEVYIDRYY